MPCSLSCIAEDVSLLSFGVAIHGIPSVFEIGSSDIQRLPTPPEPTPGQQLDQDMEQYNLMSRQETNYHGVAIGQPGHQRDRNSQRGSGSSPFLAGVATQPTVPAC